MRKMSLIQLLATGIPCLLILTLVLIVNKKYDVEIEWMTRDVTVLGRIHPFSGFVSSLGILLWPITAGICLFTSIFYRKDIWKDNFGFFLYAAFLSFYLLFDDLFTLHEHAHMIFIGGEY